MANLQIKGIDENLYAQIKKLAAVENRSVSQQILYLQAPCPGPPGAFWFMG